eukprot:UN25508
MVFCLVLEFVVSAYDLYFFDYNGFAVRRAQLCQFLGPHIAANVLFLTSQSMILLSSYFMIDYAGIPVESFLPTTFALGMFVTIFYFLLVRGSDSWHRKCNTFANRLREDIVHICPALTIFSHAFCADKKKSSVSFQFAACVSIALMLQYLVLIHLNFYHTGAWPYDVLCVESKKRVMLIFGLSVAVMLLTELGRNVSMM